MGTRANSGRPGCSYRWNAVALMAVFSILAVCMLMGKVAAHGTVNVFDEFEHKLYYHRASFHISRHNRKQENLPSEAYGDHFFYKVAHFDAMGKLVIDEVILPVRKIVKRAEGYTYGGYYDEGWRAISSDGESSTWGEGHVRTYGQRQYAVYNTISTQIDADGQFREWWEKLAVLHQQSPYNAYNGAAVHSTQPYQPYQPYAAQELHTANIEVREPQHRQPVTIIDASPRSAAVSEEKLEGIIMSGDEEDYATPRVVKNQPEKLAKWPKPRRPYMMAKVRDIWRPIYRCDETCIDEDADIRKPEYHFVIYHGVKLELDEMMLDFGVGTARTLENNLVTTVPDCDNSLQLIRIVGEEANDVHVVTVDTLKYERELQASNAETKAEQAKTRALEMVLDAQKVKSRADASIREADELVKQANKYAEKKKKQYEAAKAAATNTANDSSGDKDKPQPAAPPSKKPQQGRKGRRRSGVKGPGNGSNGDDAADGSPATPVKKRSNPKGAKGPPAKARAAAGKKVEPDNEKTDDDEDEMVFEGRVPGGAPGGGAKLK